MPQEAGVDLSRLLEVLEGFGFEERSNGGAWCREIATKPKSPMKQMWGDSSVTQEELGALERVEGPAALS